MGPLHMRITLSRDNVLSRGGHNTPRKMMVELRDTLRVSYTSIEYRAGLRALEESAALQDVVPTHVAGVRLATQAVIFEILSIGARLSILSNTNTFHARCTCL